MLFRSRSTSSLVVKMRRTIVRGIHFAIPDAEISFAILEADGVLGQFCQVLFAATLQIVV